MQEVTGEDGCPVFRGAVLLDLADSDKTFEWGVVIDGPQGNNLWAITTELKDVNSADRYREFRIEADGSKQVERFFFTVGRRLGANKRFAHPNAKPAKG